MAVKYQKKPSLADVARRRGQSILEVLSDWGLDPSDADFLAALAKRCLKEGVQPVQIEIAKSETPKNALVQLPKKESAPTVGKKLRKSKVTLDEPGASDEHDRLDPLATPGPEDSA
jgi:hypothetical protein